MRKIKPGIKNKLVAITLVLIGMLPVWLDNDYTALFLFAFFALPLFVLDEDLSRY